MKKLDQRGTGIVELLVIVVIVGLVGFVGWYLWHSKQTTEKTLNTANTTNQTTTTTPKQSTSTENKAATPAAKTNDIVNTTYTKAPSGLQAAMVAHTKTTHSSCVSGSSFTGGDPKVEYTTSGFAKTGGECGDGPQELYIEENGTWSFLSQTSSYHDCDALTQHHFIASLIAIDGTAKCYDAGTKQALIYPIGA